MEDHTCRSMNRTRLLNIVNVQQILLNFFYFSLTWNDGQRLRTMTKEKRRRRCKVRKQKQYSPTMHAEFTFEMEDEVKEAQGFLCGRKCPKS